MRGVAVPDDADAARAVLLIGWLCGLLSGWLSALLTVRCKPNNIRAPCFDTRRVGTQIRLRPTGGIVNAEIQRQAHQAAMEIGMRVEVRFELDVRRQHALEQRPQRSVMAEYHAT